MTASSPLTVGSSMDRRTALDRGRDELTDCLREQGDPATVAAVLRFVDQLCEITDRVLLMDYSAEECCNLRC